MRCAAIADRIIVVEGPARGDGIQAEKAGLLELADLIIVNKSDLPGADKVVNDLTMSLSLGNDAPEIIKVSALQGDGLDQLPAMIFALESRVSSQRARNRQRLLMSHEHSLTSNPNFEAVLDRMSQEGLTLAQALEELS
jgi:LAO/AO transport system kinase